MIEIYKYPQELEKEEWLEYLGVKDYLENFDIPVYVDKKNERAKPLGIKISDYVSINDFEKLIEDFTKFGDVNDLTRISEIIVPKSYELYEVSFENGWSLKKEVVTSEFIDYALIKEDRKNKRKTPENWGENIEKEFSKSLIKSESKNLPKVYLKSAKDEMFKSQLHRVIKEVNEDFENYGIEEPRSKFEELYFVIIENKNDEKYLPIGAIELIKMPNGIWEYCIGIINKYCGKKYGESAITELINMLKKEKNEGKTNIKYLYGDIMNLPSGKALARACKKAGIRGENIHFGIHNLQGDMFSITMDYKKRIENGYIDTFAVYIKI